MPWQTFSFHIKLPPEGCEKFRWVDLLLMDEVVGKVIEERGSGIMPWVFHRRALSVADARALTERTGKQQEPGHILNFQCRASTQAAAEVYGVLRNRATALGLGQLLERVSLPEESEGDLGDKGWPAPLRVVWPSFVHAVSEIVLQLVRQTRREKGWDCTATDPNQVQRRYREIQDHLDMLWRDRDGPFVRDIWQQVLQRCEPVRHELECLVKEHERIFVHHIHALLGYPRG
ncbi:MAG: hypothetical protein IMZ66_05950 [Planctomycetes bacterium]|nr:hypothetical protein [Planctomycetota bacterium]